MGIGMRELIIILLVVLVIFGTKKLRTIGSDLGGAVKGFKNAVKDGEAESEETAKQIKRDLGGDAEFPETKQTTTSDASKDRSA